jgi:hypothetical protein
MQRQSLQIECELEVVCSQLFGKSSFENGYRSGKTHPPLILQDLPAITLDTRRANPIRRRLGLIGLRRYKNS